MIGGPDQAVAEELASRRILQITGPLDAEEASRAAARLMTFDATGDAPVELRITGSGGTLDAAMVVIDTIDLLGVPVRATVVGVVEGPLALVAALCPERRAAPSSRLIFRSGSVSGEGSADELMSLADDAGSTLRRMADRLADATRLDKSEALEALRRGRAFDASEALAAGIVDSVGLSSLPAAGGPKAAP